MLLVLFPGLAFAWGAIHGGVVLGILVIVGVNLCYHFLLFAVGYFLWRRTRHSVS